MPIMCAPKRSADWWRWFAEHLPAGICGAVPIDSADALLTFWGNCRADCRRSEFNALASETNWVHI